VFTYGYDLLGNVALLLQDTGAAKAAYGYEPYSLLDEGLARGDRPIAAQNPLNPFRYTGDRLDSGSGGMHVGNGTRRFGPDFKRFWQRDTASPAGNDLALGLHPLWSNRHALAAGNPLNYTDAGGRAVLREGSGGGLVLDPCGCGLPVAVTEADAEAALAWVRALALALAGGPVPPGTTGTTTTPKGGAPRRHPRRARRRRRQRLQAARVRSRGPSRTPRCRRRPGRCRQRPRRRATPTSCIGGSDQRRSPRFRPGRASSGRPEGYQAW
jgi:RHS repeat-associated protein